MRKFLDLSNGIPSHDRMGCQNKIAELIIDGGGGYVLALTSNQGTLAGDVEEAFINNRLKARWDR